MTIEKLPEILAYLKITFSKNTNFPDSRMKRDQNALICVQIFPWGLGLLDNVQTHHSFEEVLRSHLQNIAPGHSVNTLHALQYYLTITIV